MGGRVRLRRGCEGGGFLDLEWSGERRLRWGGWIGIGRGREGGGVADEILA